MVYGFCGSQFASIVFDEMVFDGRYLGEGFQDKRVTRVFDYLNNKLMMWMIEEPSGSFFVVSDFFLHQKYSRPKTPF